MTNQEIINVGQQIYDETNVGANTSERVGSVIKGIGENLIDVTENEAAKIGRTMMHSETFSTRAAITYFSDLNIPAGSTIKVKLESDDAVWTRAAIYGNNTWTDRDWYQDYAANGTEYEITANVAITSISVFLITASTYGTLKLTVIQGGELTERIVSLENNVNNIPSIYVTKDGTGEVKPKNIEGVEYYAGNLFNTCQLFGTTGAASISNGKIVWISQPSSYSKFDGYLLPVQQNTNYTFQAVRFYCLVGSDGETALNDSIQNNMDGDQITINSGNASYIYFSWNNVTYPKSTYVVVQGTDITQTEEQVTLPSWLDPHAGEISLLQQNVDELQHSGTVQEVIAKMQHVQVEATNNVLDETGLVSGQYMGTTGVVANSANFGYLYIDNLSEGDILRFYYINGVNGTISVKEARFVCAFNGSTVVSDAGTQNVTSYTVPSGITKIAISIYLTTVQNGSHPMAIINDATVPTTYIEYREAESYYIATEAFLGELLSSFLPCKGILGAQGESVSFETLADGDFVELTDYPVMIKKRQKFSFRADISQMGTLYIGKGYQVSAGGYIKIDATNITGVRYTTTETLGTPVPHGLTISTYLIVTVSIDNDGNAKVILQTLGGDFTTTVNGMIQLVGTSFYKSVGTVGTNVKLSVTHEDLREQIWIAGDSYLSTNTGRWPYYVRGWGFKNFLMCARAGGGSTGTLYYNVYNDIVKALNYSTPKFLVWCLGMNDGSDTNASTPAAGWLTALKNIQSICEEKGITLILSTIPNVATINHEGKNAYVRTSGYRYIDFAKAVHGETYTSGVNNWYTGYCDDGIHPTVLGAKALASQVLVDFPEIMQYD